MFKIYPLSKKEFQDPLLRRIEGAQLIPPGSILPPRFTTNARHEVDKFDKSKICKWPCLKWYNFRAKIAADVKN